MNDIFLYIEEKMSVVVPVYMKNILKYCGYDNCHTIATINDADIDYFIDEVRQGKVNEFYRSKIDAEAIMEGCTSSVDNFVFSRGHLQLLKAIVNVVKENLEGHGANSFLLNHTKPSPRVQKPETTSKAVYGKRFKFSTSISASEPNVGPTSHSSSSTIGAKSIIIRKAVSSLITYTSRLFANNFEKMVRDNDPIRVEIDIDQGGAYICCPYCSKASSVSLSTVEQSNKSWWNTSNFDRHLQRTHANDMNKDPETICSSESANCVERYTDRLLNNRPQPMPPSNFHAINANANVDNIVSMGIILESFVNSSDRNSHRKKAGYRFDALIKMFASYIFMLSGPLAYETLNANLPLSLPSVSTVRRFITDTGPRLIEGDLRTDELLKYLKDRNLPLRVSLSEDATRITAKISYDPSTNQLVGFALPLDTNGMPIKFSFSARSISEIQSHYLKNTISTSAYIQMAQPIDESCSAFMLMIFLIDNTFTAENVLKRWRFEASKLKEKGITINNIATDGDSRPLRAMKVLTKIGQPNLTYFDCEWFSCGGDVETTFTQDATHILTKLRNRILTCSRLFPIGSKIVSFTHLKYLIEHESKDKHLLTSSDINPKDRQNYLSADKICSKNSMECLIKYVPGSEATVLYVKAMRNVIMAYIDVCNRTSTELIYCIWSAVFFFRAWRSWLLNSEKTDPTSKKSKNFYTLKDNFISVNCYTCIELNAHTLVKKLLTENQGDLNNDTFFPDLYSSQPCESTFRHLRALTSTQSTVVNCNMLDIMHRAEKIQLQSDIINHSHGTIKFPRFDKKIVTSGNNKLQKLNRTTIKFEIEKSKQSVIDDFENLGIDTSKLNFHCQVKPVFEHEITEVDSDADSDCDEIDLLYECAEEIEEEDTIESEEDIEVLSTFLSGVSGEIMLRDYTEKFLDVEGKQKLTDERSTDEVLIKEKSPFAVVVDENGTQKVVRKSSVCWLLSKDKHKLSSDRLVRVTEREYSVNSTGTKPTISADKYIVHDQISIGEWALFFEKSSPLSKMLIGMVLGFTYLDGKTFKAREYTRISAPVISDSKQNSKTVGKAVGKAVDKSEGKAVVKEVGVLCSFYTFNTDGSLVPQPETKHKFIKIEAYVGTIARPIYKDKCLSISGELLAAIHRFHVSALTTSEHM